ncbi:MAG: insulinase family protein [Oscillospiraceae bacterium]
MNNKMTTIPICDGVNFRYIDDEKFKHNRITINFILKSNIEEATINAIIPFLIRHGSEDYTDFTCLNRKLSDLYGACLSADVSKYGAYQILDLSIIAIDNRFSLNNVDIIKECSELLCSLIFKPLIKSDYFVDNILLNEKQFLSDTIEAEINDKQVYAMIRCKQIMCKDEPFAIKRYGYSEKIEEITKQAVIAAFDRIMDTALIEIMFIGSGNPTPVEEIFKEHFKNVKRNPITLDYCGQDRHSSGIKEVTEKMDISQSKLVMGFDICDVKTENEKNAVSFLTSIFGETSSSKLFKSLREKLNICYYCSAQIDRMSRIMMVDCGIEEKNKDIAQKEIIKQLELCQNGNITEDELNEIKLATQNAIGEIEDSIDSIEDWYILQIIDRILLTPREKMKEYEKLTTKDIIDAAKKIKLSTVYFLTSDNYEEKI